MGKKMNTEASGYLTRVKREGDNLRAIAALVCEASGLIEWEDAGPGLRFYVTDAFKSHASAGEHFALGTPESFQRHLREVMDATS